MKKIKTLNLPLTKEAVSSLRVGDMVSINGRIVTGRDKIHKFLSHERPSEKEIPFNLKGTIIFHCGPVIRKTRKGFDVISAGPTTSIRMEMYEHQVISEYGLRGVMGKGGMGRKTLDALKEFDCVYLHTIGGAAAYLADRIKKVIDVWKLEEFGYTDAMWLFDVKEFPAIVTMDAHGRSLHEEIEKKSLREFRRIINLD
jgi:tartrate/fumarate subfamily iron-sulfur-dependent hydro-lyase beta chain